MQYPWKRRGHILRTLMGQFFGNYRKMKSMSGGREQQTEKFTLTTSHSNAISMEATKAYPQDIDATVLRKPQKLIASQDGENNKTKSSR